MNDEPKKQEPEIMPPGPKVEPERPGPEIPSDKDVPERESHIRAANGARHGTNFIVMILPLLSGGAGGYWVRRGFCRNLVRPLATHSRRPNARQRRALLIYGPTIGAYMDREHVRGAADKAKGAIKEAAGKVAGDEGADRREAR
jgi:hypothetical protein